MIGLRRYKPSKKYGKGPIISPAVGRGRELKFRDNTWSATPVTGTAAFHHFSDMPEGSGPDRRVGRKAMVTSISARYHIDVESIEDSGFFQNQDMIRVLIFVDHQANGAFPGILDILTTAEVNAHRNLTNVGRFTVLMDRVHPAINGSNAGDGTKNQYGLAVRHYTFFKKLKVPLLFDGTSGNIAGMASNAISGAVFSFAGSEVHYHAVIRLRYTDS